MDEAVRTTASPAAIWMIVVVMSIFTAILVSAAAMADSWQARANRRARRFGVMLPGFVQPGTELSGDLASEDLIDPGAAPVTAGVPGQGGGEADDAAALTGAEAPTRPDLPAVPGRHVMPAQRDADFDRAEGSRQEGSRPENE